jgi:hypothetical protein
MTHSANDPLIVEDKNELRQWIAQSYPSINPAEELLDYIASFEGVGVDSATMKSPNFPHLSGVRGAGIGRQDKYLVYKEGVVCLLIEMTCFGIGAWSFAHGYDLIGSASVISAVSAFIKQHPEWYVTIPKDARCVFLHIWRTCKKSSFSREEIECAYTETTCKIQSPDWDCYPKDKDICRVSLCEEFKTYVYDALTALEEKAILRFSDKRYHLNWGYYSEGN